MDSLSGLKETIDTVDEELLRLLVKRAETVKELQKTYGVSSDSLFTKMVQAAKKNADERMGSIIDSLVREFSETGRNQKKRDVLRCSREYKKEDTVITINGEGIGDGNPRLIMGPCAVESYGQVLEVADILAQKGVRLLRGGAFKPRTSPYDFQGLGIEGLRILAKVAREKNMAVVTELMSAENLEEALPLVDVIQVGSRNMQNFSLLKALGRTDKPILLKRGLAATIEEFKQAAEYILSEGNSNVILCERGIRTYETATRNTLDISAVPILKQETHLPVIVDVTHSTGRKDLLVPAAKAALAVGADGIMAEVHSDPSAALSDSKQQMDLFEFEEFYKEVHGYMARNTREVALS